MDKDAEELERQRATIQEALEAAQTRLMVGQTSNVDINLRPVQMKPVMHVLLTVGKRATNNYIISSQGYWEDLPPGGGKGRRSTLKQATFAIRVRRLLGREVVELDVRYAQRCNTTELTNAIAAIA